MAELTSDARHIPFESDHRRLGASSWMDFGGFYMPLRYDGSGDIVEHQAVRNAAGVFDVSHMGELELFGPDVERFLERVFTNNVRDMKEGQARYGMLCNEDGVIIDDDIIYKRKDRWGMVVNASMTDTVFDWLQSQIRGFDVGILNVSDVTTLLALQGPKALEIVSQLAPTLNDGEFKYYNFKEGAEVGGANITVASRTGYTGENGMEFMADIENGRTLFKKLIEMGVQLAV